LIVIRFDSIEKAQAYENSAAQKEVTAARLKSTQSLSFIVEGTPNQHNWPVTKGNLRPPL
jgi:uncharacterized protein (DUF1330 family)